MKQQITKQYIQENLLTKSGGLNGRKTKLIRETTEELYLIFHKIETIPKCGCGNEITFKNFVVGYRPFCSPKCSPNSEETKDKAKSTNRERHGDE